MNATTWAHVGCCFGAACALALSVAAVRDAIARRDYLAQHCAPTGEVRTAYQPIHVGGMPRVVLITSREWRCDDGKTFWL